MSDLQRTKGYSALIPFYVLYDLDLNAHHLRLYGQIQQMESNPNPKVQPTFSYSWIADQLEIKDVRYVKRLAKLLKDKKYIERIKTDKGWLWQIVKKGVLIEDDAHRSKFNSGHTDHSPVVTQTPPGVVTQTTQRYKKEDIKEKGGEKAPTITPIFDLFSERFIPHPNKLTPFVLKLIRQATHQLAEHDFTIESYLDYLVHECSNWVFEPYANDKVNDLCIILRRSNIEKGCSGKFEDKE